MANRTNGAAGLLLPLMLSAVLVVSQAAAMDAASQAATDQPVAEARAQKQDQDILDLDEDLDGRSAYVNNQFVPSEPVELVDDEQNAPLYEILQKQMEQVLAASGPDVPIYEEDKTKRQRVQQLPNKPLFSSSQPADADDDYVDESGPESAQGYDDAEKPDAATAEELSETGYQAPQLQTTTQSPSSSTTSTTTTTTTTSTTTARARPQRRRSTTTAMPRTTRAKASPPSRLASTTQSPHVNHTELSNSSTAAPPTGIHKTTGRPQMGKPSSSNLLPHDPQIYQHKRRIIFKTISTGSQFVNSPIGDLMIKFSIGFAKPASASASIASTPSSEALRALSQNLLRNIELQKLKRINKVQKDL